MDDELMELFDSSTSGEVADSPEDGSFSSIESSVQSHDLNAPLLTQNCEDAFGYPLPTPFDSLECKVEARIKPTDRVLLTDALGPPSASWPFAPELQAPHNVYRRVQLLMQARQTMRPAANCSSAAFQQPIPKSGVLELTEEESEMLQKEGLRPPWTLPLTREREAAVKRVRRRIRNKISAQDSRRKRKAYVDSLESTFKDLLDLTSSLQAQLHEAQASNALLRQQLLSKPLCASCEGPSGLRAAGTTFLMAVLCFAVVWSGGSPRGAKFAPAPALGSPRPALPWIAASREVSEWRWSPERRFRPLPGRADGGGLPAVNGPELQSIGDGRSRWLSAPEDFEITAIGPHPQWRLVTTPNCNLTAPTEPGGPVLLRQCPQLPSGTTDLDMEQPSAELRANSCAIAK